MFTAITGPCLDASVPRDAPAHWRISAISRALWRRRQIADEHAALSIDADSSGTLHADAARSAGSPGATRWRKIPHNLFCNHLDDRAVSAEVLVIQICDQRRATPKHRAVAHYLEGASQFLHWTESHLHHPRSSITMRASRSGFKSADSVESHGSSAYVGQSSGCRRTAV